MAQQKTESTKLERKKVDLGLLISRYFVCCTTTKAEHNGRILPARKSDEQAT